MYGTYAYSGDGFAYGASAGVGGSFMGSRGGDTTTINNFGGSFGNLSFPLFDGYIDPSNSDHVGAGSSYGVGGSFLSDAQIPAFKATVMLIILTIMFGVRS
jgi:hypothetical protein